MAAIFTSQIYFDRVKPTHDYVDEPIHIDDLIHQHIDEPTHLYNKVSIKITHKAKNDIAKHRLCIFYDIENPLTETEFQKLCDDITRCVNNIFKCTMDKVKLRDKTIMDLYVACLSIFAVDDTLELYLTVSR